MSGKLYALEDPATRRGSIVGRVLLWLVIVCLVAESGSWKFTSRLWGQDPAPESQDRGPTAESEGSAEAAPSGHSRKATIPTDPIGLFRAGGVLMWPLLLASIVAVWVALERLVALRRRRVIPRAFVDRFLQHLEDGKLTPESALHVCEDNNSPIAEIFAHGVRKWGKPSVEVEQAMIDGGERQVQHLRNHLRILHGVYTVTPMLGLLGTVWGMIHGFNDIALANQVEKAEKLAQHIAIAFLNTAGGLVVAIPALILYMYFAGRVDSLVMEMDSLAQQVVNLISGEALAARPKPQVKSASAVGPPTASVKPKLTVP